MTSYRLFARLETRHPYFRDGLGRQVRFVPTQGTSAFLKAWGFLMREGSGALELFVDTFRLEQVWQDRWDEDQARSLDFTAGSTDPRCATYTSIPSVLPLKRGEGGGTWQDGIPAPPEDPEDSIILAPGPWTALAKIQLPLILGKASTLEEWQGHFGLTWQLPLQGRATIWKYLLLGDWEDRRLQILDASGQIPFSDPQEELLPDGQKALAIRSQIPIPLQEASGHRFQLRDAEDPLERVLIRRLPDAVPGRFHRDVSRGDPALVSEIFINR